MRKINRIQKGKKVLYISIIAAVAALGTIACGSTESETETPVEIESSQPVESSEEESTAETVTQTAAEEEMPLFGQITEIDEDMITLALAEQPALPEGEKPGPETEGEEAAEIPTQLNESESASEETAGAAYEEGSAEEASEATQNPDGQADEEISLHLTGETRTIQISDTTKVIINGEEASVAALSVNDVVTVEMEGDTVVSITAGMEEQEKTNGAEKTEGTEETQTVSGTEESTAAE